jgi:cysteinyl-tRNA synthetase
MSDYKLSIYNSLGRVKEEFTPISNDKVNIYVCGPTVYNYAHIGNARPAVVFDVLVRVLRALYPEVQHVSNITDIEDKIIDAARKEGVPIDVITKKYAEIYNSDMASLGVNRPDEQPLATDYINEMIAMIAQLIENGHAYEKDGHVLFNVPSYEQYGCLSGRNRDEQIAGARVEVAPYKRDPADFVLWKPSNEDQPGWDSPWGSGRPGWHIECSAMSKALCGDVFDIHGGGIDLTFPHHENEIAQSCCANGSDNMARYWVHNGFVTVEGEKMSKSIGNVLLVHDLIKEASGEVLRFNLLSAQYRQPLDWTASGLKSANAVITKFYTELLAVPDYKDIQTSYEDLPQGFMSALCDDLNTPRAAAELHSLFKEFAASADKASFARQIKAAGALLGVLQEDPAQWLAAEDARKQQSSGVDAEKVEALIAERTQARADKDFAKSDALRDELSAMGVVIKDGPEGTSWELA